MKTTRAVATTLLLSILIGSVPAFAQPQKPKTSTKGSDDASERFNSGVAFYKEGDFTAALVEFKRAYELSPNYRVLFNLGQTSRELKDHASALVAFEKYLNEGGKEVDATRRESVEVWIEELKKKVGNITVETNVEGAEILIDDVPVGTTPLSEPVVVNAGRRKFVATLSGHTPAQRAVDVAGSDRATVKLELVKVGGPERPDGPKRPVEPVEAETPIAAWVVFSATAAGAVVTGVMGGLALAARGDLDKALGTFPGDATAIDDAQSRTGTFALATDIAGGVTIAGAITTIVLFAVAGSSSSDTPAPTTGVSVSPSGIVVFGAF